MLARKRGSGVYYYLSRSDGNRRVEVPLGNALAQALTEYHLVTHHTKRPIIDIVATAGELYRRARKGARQRAIQFDLTLADVERLLVQSDKRCMLTGIPFDLARTDGVRRRLWAPSIDRIKCDLGYAVGNVRVIAVAVNVAMSDFGEEFLLRIAHALVVRQRTSRQGIAEVAE